MTTIGDGNTNWKSIWIPQPPAKGAEDSGFQKKIGDGDTN